ncbi:MAG: hypothetical protein KBF88_01385 [Polyangiaceae bacterium]|nr:hypothetical protein [Polyangiaceae bacterium]
MNKNMRFVGSCLVIGTACVSVACGWNTTPPDDTGSSPTKQEQGEADACLQADFELHRHMRVLWGARVSVTRLYIVSALADLPDTGYVAARLTKNHVDLGASIKPYYGEAIGDELARVLNDYAEGTTAYMLSARGKDEAEMTRAYKAWCSHAEEVAAYFAAINPNLKEAEWRIEMQKHLELTRSQITSRLAADWTGDLAFHELSIKQALRMSDLLSEGIAKQFPRHTE